MRDIEAMKEKFRKQEGVQKTYARLFDRLFRLVRRAKTDADHRRIRMKDPNPIPRMRADMMMIWSAGMRREKSRTSKRITAQHTAISLLLILRSVL